MHKGHVPKLTMVTACPQIDQDTDHAHVATSECMTLGDKVVLVLWLCIVTRIAESPWKFSSYTRHLTACHRLSCTRGMSVHIVLATV